MFLKVVSLTHRSLWCTRQLETAVNLLYLIYFVQLLIPYFVGMRAETVLCLQVKLSL